MTKARKDKGLTRQGAARRTDARQRQWQRWAVSKMLLARGKEKVSPEPCVAVCDRLGDVQHHVDYGRPLDVVWFCHPHHREWHRHYKPFYPDGWPPVDRPVDKGV